MSPSTGRESQKFIVRLPEGMRARIKAAADRNSRSMNAEIVATLAERYPSPPSLDALLAEAVGMKNLLALANVCETDRPALVAKINRHLQIVDLPMRLTLKGGRIESVVIGDFWDEDMAIEDGVKS